MRCWIILLASSLLWGCARCPPRGEDRKENRAAATRNVVIQRFACMDLKNQFPEDPVPTQVAEEARIDNWGRGGPGGSNWNSSDLLCSTEGSTTCESGVLVISLWAGKKLADRTTIDLSGGGAFATLMKIPQEAWLDQQVKEEVGDHYETVTFRSTATLKCTKPYQAGPQHTLAEEHVDHAFFVAGFAFGE